MTAQHQMVTGNIIIIIINVIVGVVVFTMKCDAIHSNKLSFIWPYGRQMEGGRGEMGVCVCLVCTDNNTIRLRVYVCVCACMCHRNLR